jgi:uncharacterized membrane protein (UPF0127 family)
MNRKKLRRYFIAALIVFFAGLAAWFLFFVPTAKGTARLTAGGTTITVEIADTQFLWVKGLSGRPSLPPDRGMLFVFPNSEIRNFWMAGMRFPLDMVWLDGDKVVDVATLQAPTLKSPMPESHAATLPADKVLELNAGMADKLGMHPGSRIVYPAD